MARVYPDTRIRQLTKVDGQEVRDELRNLIGEVNGRLDRGNAPTNIRANKFAAGTFDEFWVESANTLQVVDRPEGAGPHHWYDIPDMRADITTVDGALELELVATWSNVTSVNHEAHPDNVGNGDIGAPVAIAIEVDGNIVARSGAIKFSGTSHASVNAYMPIGAGEHVVKGIMSYVGTNQELGGEGAAIDTADAGYVGEDEARFRGRTLVVRHIKR